MTTSKTSSQSIDLQINAKQILPFHSDSKAALDNHAILIKGGIIHDILPQSEVAQKLVQDKLAVEKTVNLNEHILFPGMHNAFCSLNAIAFHHIGMDLPLNLRLQNKIKSLENNLNSEINELSNELAVASLLRSGVTSFNSQYRFEYGKIKNNHQLETNFLVTLSQKNSNYTFEQQLAQYLQLRDDNKHNKNLNLQLSVDNFLDLTEQQINKLSGICNELGIKLHTSLNPINTDLNTSTQQKSIFSLLKKYALLSPDFQLTDIYGLSRQDLSLLAKTKTNCIISPIAQLTQATSLSPIDTLKNLQAKISIGSNNYLSSNLNLLKEIQLLAWLAKLESNNAQLFDAKDLLSFAIKSPNHEETEQVSSGRLAKGFKANIAAIKSNENIDNACDPFSQIVYTGNQLEVSHLWLNGMAKVENYQVSDIDEAYLLKQLNQWRKQLI